MRFSHSVLIGSLLVVSAACAKTPAPDAPSRAAAAEPHAGDGSAAGPRVGPVAGPVASPVTDPAPEPPPAHTIAFPTKEELIVIVEQVKVLEIRANEGKLPPEELQEFMAVTKRKFPPGVEPPLQLIEGDQQFMASQQELVGVLDGLTPQDLEDPATRKRIEAKLTPITLKLMRRTFEILIEKDWQPPAPGAPPAPPN